MPTISINRKDFEQLIGQPATEEQIVAWLPLVKGEIKEEDRKTGELRIELQDSNRPDLWSCEGIARQIRVKLAGAASPYPFFRSRMRPTRRLLVSPGLERVRPYVAACTAVGYAVTDIGLVQLIQVQEKLSDVFGRKRQKVSIGLYRLSRIKFPVHYDLVKPDEARFTPLGFEQQMSLREILAVHPKGLEYGPILTGQELVPLLRDDAGQVLSMPPIVNSREVGEVRVGDRELFVEVTGTDLLMVVLTLNILAVNLADRGAAIEHVEMSYPCATPLGKTVWTPFDFGKPRSTPIKTIEAALGQPLAAKTMQSALRSYGYEVRAAQNKLSVKPPPYRNDLMHVVDVAEDMAISLGYERFAPEMPTQFTVGNLSRLEVISDRIRDLMVGFGFQEIISNILASRLELVDHMRLAGSEWDRLVEVANVMSQSYACLRQWITPSLLRVEATSSRSFYPHRLFEVGETVVPDPTDEMGSRTLMVLGALIAHASANFSEVHSCLDLLLFYLNQPYTLEPMNHPSFLEGRAGRIVSEGRTLGLIGELHPETLEHWQVSVPAAVFELEVDALAEERKR
ncbi:MAG TPA: phenylalanine--tRNA ligase subunit beta [Nitrospiraceae bacterium]|nr:phenylalanine--tRNA ligase subunit beta [Nitrospiraceae bacterium]